MVVRVKVVAAAGDRVISRRTLRRRGMSEVFPGDRDVKVIFAAAFLKGGPGQSVGTDHLLAALVDHDASAGVLYAMELTPTVVRAVVRDHGTELASADEGIDSDGPAELLMTEGGNPTRFTPAAAEAMRRAVGVAHAEGRAQCSPADILVALSDDPTSRAVELLTWCGVEVPVLRRALRTGEPPTFPDRVDAELRRPRDAMLGRIKYRTHGWRQWATSLFSRARPNYAQAPVVWVEFETIAQAKQRGRRDPGTDDLLLAVLATYEVAQRYPHLARPAGDGYNGGRLLAEADVRYHDAYRLAQHTDLGLDPHPLRRYVPTLPDDTAALLRSVLTGPPNRATRLLTTAGVDVSRLYGG
jgi:hypothetical protein